MAHQLRAQVTIPSITSLPEDAVTNTWYFDGGDVGASPADTANDSHDRLEVFYAAIDAIFSGEVVGPATVRWYNLADPTPRTPVLTRTMAIDPVGGTGFPSEVAICLSFHAAYVSGVPNARRRGRVYLGPIDNSRAEVVDGKVMVANATRIIVKDAAAALLAANSVDAAWAVYSPTTDAEGASVADSFNDVVGGYVDNAWDTQRRRGMRPTARTLFGAN